MIRIDGLVFHDLVKSLGSTFRSLSGKCTRTDIVFDLYKEKALNRMNVIDEVMAMVYINKRLYTESTSPCRNEKVLGII